MIKVYPHSPLNKRVCPLFIAFVGVLFLLPFGNGFSQCLVSGTGAATAPNCSNQTLLLGAGEYKTMSFAAGVYYTFSFANNAQTNGICVNGVQYTGSPITIAPGAGTFNVGMYRNTGTWAAASASLTYRIETPAAPQAVGNITVGPAAGLAGSLPDASISASGCWNGGGVNSNCSAGGVGGHEAYRGRLFRSTYVEGGTIAWAVDQNGTNDYWQVDLGAVIPVNGIASQGREECCTQWVTSYSVQTSIDGSTWYAVPGTFSANSNENTVVINWIGQYHARYVRITVLGYSGHQSSRYDVLSIPEGSSASAQTVYASAQLMPNTGEIRWYDAASGGTYLGSGRTIGRNITANTTIYAASYNGGCESARTPVTLRINDVYGQGPAGVGNTNGKSDLTCWLDASKINQATGSAISTWSDQSGLARNATQATAANQPSLQTAAGLNNLPVVRFSTSGTADQMSTANFQAQYGGYTVFSAAKLNGGTNSRLITSSVRNWLMGFWGGNVNVTYNEGWNSAAGCAVGGIAANTNSYIHQTNSTGPNTLFYSNGNTVLAGGGTCGIQSFGGFALGGGCCPGFSEVSDGDIGEVISYDRAVNEARRLIVQNYLAAKYNIVIANDLYAGDGIGDCDFDVSGVGRESSGIHTSGWSGGLYVSTTLSDYLKDNGDYVIFGRNSSTGGWETSNLATCGSPNPSRRLSRIWYIDKTDVGTAGGNITLAFDLNELQSTTPLSATNYRLMYRAGNTGNFTGVATGSVSGNRVQFVLNVSAINDGQYTLAYESDAPRSLALNGSTQYIEIPNSTSLQTAGNFSYEMWVRPTAFSSYNTYFENGMWSGQTLILRQDNPSQIFLYANGVGLGAITYAPPLNAWTHLALVRSGSTITLYANGVSVGTFSSYATSILPTNVMRIGSSVHTTGQLFVGQIDEFRLWNKALLPAEITGRMHANLTNTEADWTNLQAYYKFDESGGGKVFDLSQNNNNGTAVNSPTPTALYPATISDITGTNPSCNGTAVNYSAPVSNGNSRLLYNWSVTGATINSGQGSNTINVTWTSSGTQNIAVTVSHSTECYIESFNKNITVDVPSTVPTSVTGGGTFCPGNTIPLTRVGGTLGGVANWEWFTGSCGGSAAGTGTTINVSPTATTTYYVRASANGGCPATACVSGNVTMPTPTNTLSLGSSATCVVAENAYVHFYDNTGRLIMSINSNGQNLGTVSATSYVSGAPVNIQACGTYQPWYVTAALGRRWAVTPQFQPVSPVSVRLYFDNSETNALSIVANSNSNPNDNYATLGSLDLTKYSNTNPALIDGSFANNCGSGTSTVHTSTGFGVTTALFPSFSGSSSYTQYSFTGFSELWLSGTTNISPLPIVLTSFTADCHAGMVHLNWETATEINNEIFLIDRSTDMMTWEQVVTVPGANNSNEPLAYQAKDERPLQGVSYYRLTQRDFDGATETFDPISVTCYSDGNGNIMMVYPNPANDRFTVKFVLEEDMNNGVMDITDLNGKTIISKNMSLQKGNYEFSFDATTMRPGIYTVRVRSSVHVSPIKLIIK